MTRTAPAQRGPTRLQGTALAIARTGWFAFAALAVIMFAAAVPARWAYLTQPSPAIAADLTALGLAVPLYATYLLSFEIALTVVFLAIGAILYLRGASEPMALLAALFLVAFGVGNQTVTPVVDALYGVNPIVNFLILTLYFVAWVSFGWFLYLFPSGRFAPAWTKWLALAWLLFCIPYNYGMGTPLYPLNWPPWLAYTSLLVFWISWLAGQVYRYFRVSGLVERQQTKWVVFGLALLIGAILVEMGLFTLFPDLLKPEWLLGQEPTTAAGLATLLAWLGILRLTVLALPISIAISILRYRLWDIDQLINRALVYGGLTAALGGVYFGSVVILQALLEALTGQATRSPLAVVASTLAIAALFAPLRRRLQDFIDRRFYRRRYNAAQTLAAFGAVARDETDLDRLAGELVDVINETVQPSTTSLWLKPPASAGQRESN